MFKISLAVETTKHSRVNCNFFKFFFLSFDVIYKKKSVTNNIFNYIECIPNSSRGFTYQAHPSWHVIR